MKQFLKILRRILYIIIGKDVFYKRQVKCISERHGSAHGGWIICPTHVNEHSIIYSFGIGTDISFELSVSQKYRPEIHAFDPTPRSIEWVKKQNISNKVILHEYGLADRDGTVKFYPPDNPEFISHSIYNHQYSQKNSIEVPVKRLNTIMQELNHSRIDILKMDIEGSEYQVVEDILDSQIEIYQILIEFHHRFSNIDVQLTKNAIQNLNNHPYKIFYSSPLGEEYCFIKVK
jgi:FkbM family methyltransferase